MTIDIGYMEIWTILQGLTFHLFSVSFFFLLNKILKREEPFLSEQRNITALLSAGIYQVWARTEDQACHM